MTITIDQGDQIRQAWYIMDGPSDRPWTIPECHGMIQGLLDLLGAITGITSSGTISPAEEAQREDTAPEGPPRPCAVCNGTGTVTALPLL
jgi:hypothetical protein